MLRSRRSAQDRTSCLQSVVSMASHGLWANLKVLVFSVLIQLTVQQDENKVVKFLDIHSVKTAEEFTKLIEQPTVTAAFFMLKGKILTL